MRVVEYIGTYDCAINTPNRVNNVADIAAAKKPVVYGVNYEGLTLRDAADTIIIDTRAQSGSIVLAFAYHLQCSAWSRCDRDRGAGTWQSRGNWFEILGEEVSHAWNVRLPQYLNRIILTLIPFIVQSSPCTFAFEDVDALSNKVATAEKPYATESTRNIFTTGQAT